jgi:hypothetical protein
MNIYNFNPNEMRKEEDFSTLFLKNSKVVITEYLSLLFYELFIISVLLLLLFLHRFFVILQIFLSKVYRNPSRSCCVFEMKTETNSAVKDATSQHFYFNKQ